MDNIKKMGIALVAAVGNYTPTYVYSDLAKITGDVIGQAAIETKDFTSLFVLLGVAVLGVGAWAMFKRQ